MRARGGIDGLAPAPPLLCPASSLFPVSAPVLKLFPFKAVPSSLPAEFAKDFSVTSFLSSAFVVLMARGCTLHLGVLFLWCVKDS